MPQPATPTPAASRSSVPASAIALVYRFMCAMASTCVSVRVCDDKHVCMVSCVSCFMCVMCVAAGLGMARAPALGPRPAVWFV